MPRSSPSPRHACLVEKLNQLFIATQDPREDSALGRGTRISLYLKDEALEYLEPHRLRDLIKKYSEFINYDIYLYTSKVVEEEVEVEEEEEEAPAGA